MKKLSTLAGVCAGLLFVSVCVGLMTAVPVVGQGNAVSRDVLVVNTVAQPVPIVAASLPPVQVSSLPAVQIGNAAANPVPVEVTNPPSEQAASEPITIRGEFIVSVGDLGQQVLAYTVPEGKRLVIEFVSVDFSEEVERNHQFDLFIFDNIYSAFSVYFDMNGKFFSNTGGSHRFGDRATKQVQVFAGPGDRVNFLGRRSSSGATGSYRFVLTGHLMDIP